VTEYNYGTGRIAAHPTGGRAQYPDFQQSGPTYGSA